MGTYRFDFNLEAWITDLEIEANSREEAEDKLYSMPLEEIIEKGIVQKTSITDVDCDFNETQKYHVYNINYDITMDDIDAESEKEVEEFKARLPKELDVEITVDDDSYDSIPVIEEMLADEISEETNYLVSDFDYKRID